MKSNSYLSAADRKQKSRYERIVQNKESYSEYFDAKKKARKNRKQFSTRPSADLNFEKLNIGEMPAVQCRTKEEARHLLWQIRKHNIRRLDNREKLYFKLC